jgi:hypothetical protein
MLNISARLIFFSSIKNLTAERFFFEIAKVRALKVNFFFVTFRVSMPETAYSWLLLALSIMSLSFVCS